MTTPAGSVYKNVDEFFDLRFAPLFARPLRQVWCVKWREHPEALDTMTLLWKTWETAIINATADSMVVWKRDFAYPLVFDRLCDPAGTFAGCDWKEQTHDPSICKPLGKS